MAMSYQSRLRIAAWAAISLMVIGCGTMRFPRVMTIGDDDWSTEGGGPLRTNAVNDSLQMPYRILWEFDPKAGLQAAPLVRDSIVIVGNMRGDLVLLDIASGKPLGAKSYGVSVEGTPALAGYLIFVPVADEEGIVAIDVKDGSVRWEGSLGPVGCSPLILEERVYVAALSGKVHCLNRYTGEEIWAFTPKGERVRSIRSSPACANGVLYVGADDGRIFALDAASGAELWTYQAGGSIFATVLVAGSMIVAPSLDSTVYAVDSRTGELRWHFQAGSIFYGPAATDGQRIYVGAGNGRLYCLDAETGHSLWSFATGSVINSQPLVTANAVVVGSLDRSLYVVEKTTGSELWRFGVKGRLRVPPVLWRGYLIVSSENRTVSVLVPDGGRAP